MTPSLGVWHVSLNMLVGKFLNPVGLTIYWNSPRYVVIWSTHGAAHTWGCSSFLEAIKGGAYLFALQLVHHSHEHRTTKG